MNKSRKLDNDKIDTFGVNSLENCINSSDYLKAYFKRYDKYPLWDGHIFVYKTNSISISDFVRRIPVQIKTTTTKNKNSKLQYRSISRNNLKAYYNDGGILYFYICKNNSQYTIYYSALTQLRIKQYIDSNDGKNILIGLSVFPKDNIELFTNILIEFAHERDYKPSNISFPIGDLNKLRQAGYDELSIKISTIGYKNPIDRIFDQPVYLHAKNKTAGIEIPYCEAIIKGTIQENNNRPIKINNKIFYVNFTFSKEKDKITYFFGKNIQLSFNAINNDAIKFNLSINASGSLSERITDINFLLSLFKYQIIVIEEKEYKLPISEEEWNKNNPTLNTNILNKNLEYYTDIKETFDILKMRKQLDFSGLDESGYRNLDFLIAGIKNNLSQNVNNLDEPYVIKNLKISNLWIKVIMVKQDDGKYLIENFFDADLICFYPSQNMEKSTFHVSLFVILEPEDFIKISNVNYEKIHSSFLKLPDDDELFQMTVWFILKMLSAYDKLNEKENELLDCSHKLTDWLLTKNTNLKSLLIINKLQIIRRTRELNDEEKAMLLEIASNEEDNNILICTYILLDNSTMSKKYYEKLTPSEKEGFNEYPICYFKKFDI
jgi:hypothetical protein